jgi:vitamin B12 transporter
MKRIAYTFAALAIAQTAFSQQQQDTIQGNPLDNIIVTANKMEQKQNTTGKVVSVITREQLEKSAGKTVAQLLNEQAGVVVNGALNNAGGVQTVYMRGASSGRTLILMDGIPVSDPSMINNEYDLNLFSVNDVERIEVCRGAQSTLYGSDAIAGVINIITVKQNVQKPLNFKSTISSGSYGTVKANLQAYGKKDKLTYTARYGRIYSNGFSSAYDSTGNKNFDNDSYDGHVANGQLQYQVAPSLTVKTFAMYSRYKAGVDAGVFADDKDYTIKNTSFTTGAGFTWKKTGYSITGNYQYNELTRHYLNDSFHKTGTWYADNNYFGKTQFIELYSNVTLGGGFSVLAGVDYRYSSYNQQYLSVSSFGPYTSSQPTTDFNQKAAYASVLYANDSKNLNIELGGRFNKHSIYGDNSTFTFNPSFTFDEHFRMFGSVSSGFKAPSLYQLANNKNLDPERSMSYEGGLGYTNDNISARAVFFYRNTNNGIDYNYVSRNYFNYINQKVNGVELEVSTKIADLFTVNANYTLLSPQETTQNRITNKDTITYSYLLRRPDNSANLTISVEPVEHLLVSVSGKYASKRWDIGGYMKPDAPLNSYFLLGAYTEYKYNEQVKFFVDLQNITNKKFFDVMGYNSIPFLLNAGVSFNF